jgi:hypothetical protein
MHRRTALKIVALSAVSTRFEPWGGACSAPSGERTAWTAADYQLQFFTAAENDLLDQLMEIIIPAEEHSGGAHAARVSFFADRMISSGAEGEKNEWRSGLAHFKQAASKSSVAEALARAAAAESNPRSDLERFFISLKQMTVNGYYSSEIGIHQDLEYQGNTYLAEFPECTKH